MSLQAVFKHKANAEDGVAPSLFDPATVETFEAKQKRAEQETYAAISNSGGEVSTSYAPISARIRDVKQGAESESVKKRKARESLLAESLKILNDILDQMEQAARDIAEINGRIDQRTLDKEAFAAALSVDSLDELDEDQRTRVMRAIDEYQEKTGRKIDPNNKDDWAVAVELMDFENDLALIKDREDLSRARDEFDDLAEKIGDAQAVLKDEGVDQKARHDIRNRIGDINQQVEALANVVSDEFGVDAEVELFLKTLAQLQQKYGENLTSEDISDRVGMLSQEAQQEVMDLEEVQAALEVKPEPEAETSHVTERALEQSSSLNMLSSF